MRNPGKPHATPTPRAEWPAIGDTVTATDGPDAMRGIVEAFGRGSIPAARVRWANGAVGRHTVTTLRRDPNE